MDGVSVGFVWLFAINYLIICIALHIIVVVIVMSVALFRMEPRHALRPGVHETDHVHDPSEQRDRRVVFYGHGVCVCVCVCVCVHGVSAWCVCMVCVCMCTWCVHGVCARMVCVHVAMVCVLCVYIVCVCVHGVYVCVHGVCMLCVRMVCMCVCVCTWYVHDPSEQRDRRVVFYILWPWCVCA